LPSQKKERLTEAAIAALLRSPTVAQAASVCGVSEGTLLRWMKQPEFAKEYRAAKRQAVEVAVGLLQKAAGQATATLVRVMNDPATPAGVRVAAARTVLDQALRSVEIEEFDRRLSDLEEMSEAKRMIDDEYED
jgi:hypothetical protein